MAERHALSLRRWAETLRRDRSRRRRLHRRLALGLAGCAALAATLLWPPRPLLVWNASASARIGLYWVAPWRRPERGDMVVAWTPEPWRQLAAVRRYLPANVPLVKRVVAVEGDSVCARDGQVYVNGRWAAWQQPFDAAGRPMPAWHGCRRLGPDALFLLMDARHSFDGRYFGPTATSDIIGPATLLWPR